MKANLQPPITRRAQATVWLTCFALAPEARRSACHSSRCSPRGRLRWASNGSMMPARSSSALRTIAASICCAATLFAESGMGFVEPGSRPYHLPDFFFTFFAPGVPAFTFRDFTNRAPGAPSSQGRPSASIQQSRSQCCTTVTLNRLLAIFPSLLLVEGRPGQAQPQVRAQLRGGRQCQGALAADESGQLRLVDPGLLAQPVHADPAAGDGPAQLLDQVGGAVPLLAHALPPAGCVILPSDIPW